MSDYDDHGILLDGWGDYMQARDEERWYDAEEEYRASAQEACWRAEEERQYEETKKGLDAAAKRAQKAAKNKARKARRALALALALASVQGQGQGQGQGQETKAQKPAFVVPPGSVVKRNTIVSPDGWVTVVPRGSKIMK